MIEKILAVDEALDPTLPVAGTTGYDALREIGGLFVDPTGKQALTELVDSAGGDYALTPVDCSRAEDRRDQRDVAQRVGPAVPGHRGGRRRRPSRPCHGCRVASQPRRRVPVGLPVIGDGAADGAGRNRRRGSTSGRAAGHHRRRDRDQLGGRGAAATALRCRDRQVDGRLPVLPRRAADLTQRSGRRARVVRGRRRRVPRSGRRPSTPVAVGHDDAVHPRHQTRRRRPRADRRPVAGAVAVGRTGRRSGSRPHRPPTWRRRSSCCRTCSGYGRRTGTSPTSCASACMPTPRRRSAKRVPAPPGTTPTTGSNRPCTIGSTKCSTVPSPRS